MTRPVRLNCKGYCTHVRHCIEMIAKSQLQSEYNKWARREGGVSSRLEM